MPSHKRSASSPLHDQSDDVIDSATPSKRTKRDSSPPELPVLFTSTAPDPASKVPEDSELTKSDAMSQYKLKSEDLAGVPHKVRDTVTSSPSHTYYLYKEIDVERIAWQRYGGPNGFRRHLDKLRETYHRRYPDRVFLPEPQRYDLEPPEPAQDYARMAERAKHERAVDLLAEKFPAPWLYEACRDCLRRSHEVSGASEDEHRVTDLAALAHYGSLPVYPARPAETLPASQPVDALRALLGSPPDRPRESDGAEDGPSAPANETIAWDKHYLEKIYGALLDIVSEHGIDGWRSARWEVYDRHGECVGNLRHSDTTWTDAGYCFLQGGRSGIRDGEHGRKLTERLPSDDGCQDYDCPSAAADTADA